MRIPSLDGLSKRNTRSFYSWAIGKVGAATYHICGPARLPWALCRTILTCFPTEDTNGFTSLETREHNVCNSSQGLLFGLDEEKLEVPRK